MGLRDWIRRLFGRTERVTFDVDPETFVFLVIRDAKGPMERGADYEDPLEQHLQRNGFGEISGGGSQLGDLREDGTRGIEWCGVDVDLVSTDVRVAALEMLRAQLVELGAPVGTEVHYTEDSVMLRDHLADGGWQLRLPREARHPAFGC